ncbi:hypothetical protein JXB31_04140 [Candidatus Woesearchaeota archaeon]|nr:hypothetical protein [Candidatus Woesearchaeota archaeon]
MVKDLLKPTTMVIGIIGFIISAVYTASGRFNEIFSGLGKDFGLSIGFSFSLVFLIMTIAAIVSITPSSEELKELK